MKFHGNFKAIPLKNALLKILKEHLTGNLKIHADEVGDVNLYFKVGELAYYQSRSLSETHWPKVLLENGNLTKADFELMASQGIKGLSGLVSSQILDEKKAAQFYQTAIQEEIYSLFLISDGEFAFETLNEAPKIFANMSLFGKIKFNLKSILDEGLRRSEDHDNSDGISSNDIYHKLKEKEKLTRSKLTKEELIVYELIDGVNTVFDILKQSGSKKQEISIVLKKLIELQGIKLSNTKDLLVKGSELTGANQFEAASKIYLRLVETEKTVLSHRELLAETYINSKKTDKAIVQLEHICKSYVAQKDFSKSNEGFKKILELDSSKVIIRELIANNYLELKQVPEAVAELMQLFDFYINSSAFDDAQRIYNKIIQLDPENIEVMSIMARTCAVNGHRDQAVEIWLKLSGIYIGQNQTEEATDVLNKILKIEPKNEEAKSRLQLIMRSANRSRNIRYGIMIAIVIISSGLLYIFGPKSYNQVFPGQPTFEQEVERCKLISKWLKKKKIDEITICGLSDTLTTVLKKEGLKVKPFDSSVLGLKLGDLYGITKVPPVKGVIINDTLKKASIEELKQYFETNGVIYFRSFDDKINENEPLYEAILEYVKKGQICVVLPKFVEKDVRKLSLKNRVQAENIFIDDTNFAELEKWHEGILKNQDAKKKK